MAWTSVRRIGARGRTGIGVGALLVGAVCLVWGAGRLRADLFTSDDRVQMLYSNRFEFDRRGIPLIRVRVAEGMDRIDVRSDSGLVVMPLGRGGPEVRGARSWEVRVEQSRPAKVRYWVVLESRPGSASSWARGRASWYRSKGLSAKVFEVGTIFAVSGTVVDNRTTLVAASPTARYERARRRAVSLARRFGVKTRLHAELVSRSRGLVIARNRVTGMEVRGRGMLWFRSLGRGRVWVHRPTPSVGISWSGKADRSYWGMMYAAVDRNGHLALVNSVPADRLLAGLVPAEIYASAPMAALRAQAVAARGQLLVKLGTRHLADPYLMCASQHCQVYAGAGREHPRTTAAVSNTRGLVLVDSKGRLADTVFHAVCGGHTESSANVWGTAGRDHLQGVSDLVRGGSTLASKLILRHLRQWIVHPPESYCSRALGPARRKLFRWTKRVGLAWLTRSLGRKLRIGQVLGIDVLSRGRSGRALSIRVRGTEGAAVVRGELRIRRALGGLRSSMFIVDAERDARGRVVALVFRGGGWGHGVGMCQMGAMGRAKAGWAFRRILGHYYPRTRLVKMY